MDTITKKTKEHIKFLRNKCIALVSTCGHSLNSKAKKCKSADWTDFQILSN